MKKTVLFVIFFSSVLAFAAPQGKVRVGVIMDQTTNRTASEETIRGIHIGAEYLKKNKNQILELELTDSGPLASGTRRAMMDARKKKYDILIAEIASSKAEVAASVAEENEQVMITPYATAISITQKRKYVFRTCAVHTLQSVLLAKELVRKKGLQKGAVIYDIGQLYSSDLAKEFMDEFEKQGGKIPVFQGILSSNESFADVISKIREAAPNFLFLPMYEDVTARFVSQLVDKGTPSYSILGGDAWQPGAVFKPLVFSKFPDLELSFVTHHNPDGKSPLQREFEEMYKQRFGVKPETSGSYLAFDTILVIGELFSGPSHLTQKQIRDRLRNQVKVRGTTGTIEFAGKQDPQNKSLYMNWFKGPKMLKVEELTK